MAGEGAKKRLEQNQARLKALRLAILLTTCLYAAVRLYARAASRGPWHWVGLGVTLLAHAGSYLAIAASAAPTYSGAGALLDGGGDLNKGAASAYADVLYITCAVQALAAFSDWGWWLYATVPSYGCYKLWTGFIYPNFIKARPDPDSMIDDKTRARLDRANQRAERRRVKRF
ncbi:MAG: hypothetical protein J3K34DRAFT_410315 [Monoraphidium minutum]|nr:MAG: hypothetical protein J3K34DRAFT_410315 [Monoraphidium minutum]